MGTHFGFCYYSTTAGFSSLASVTMNFFLFGLLSLVIAEITLPTINTEDMPEDSEVELKGIEIPGKGWFWFTDFPLPPKAETDEYRGIQRRSAKGQSRRRVNDYMKQLRQNYINHLF